jgi:hypothetical protein
MRYRSSDVGGRGALRQNSLPTLLPSSSSHQYSCGFALMSPRPSELPA